MSSRLPPGWCSLSDIDAGGTNDGGGAFANDGSFTVYELWHPVDSADDAHDFSLGSGDTIAFFLSLRMIAEDGGFGDTGFWGDLVIAQAPEPATLALLGIALAGLGFGRRKTAA